MKIDLSISVTESGPITVVSLVGDLDDFNAPKLRDYLADLVEKNDIDDIVLDMDHLAFLDSIGLGAVVKFAKTFSESGGRLIVVSMKMQVVKLLETSGLLQGGRLRLFDTVDQAKAALG